MPVDVVREPVGKTVLKNSGTKPKRASRCCKRTCRKNCLKKFWNKSKRFGFVPKFLDKMEKFCFCFKKFWNTSKRFGFVPKFFD